MVLKREVVERRLEELDTTLERLSRHRHVSFDEYGSDPLSGHFGRHSETYQASLDGLNEEHVIPRDLHEDLEGMGGFRDPPRARIPGAEGRFAVG